MIIETKIRKIGNSLGIVLPKEAIQALNVEEGASVYLTEGADSSIRVTANDPEFKKKVELAESIMRRYRNAFRELAK
jgi:putative addiction module antidote